MNKNKKEFKNKIINVGDYVYNFLEKIFFLGLALVLLILLIKFLFMFIYGLKPLYSPKIAEAGVVSGGTQMIKDTATDLNPTKSFNASPTLPVLSMPVGNFTTESLQNKPSETWLGEYIKAWYDYIVGAIGIIAVVVVMWGGILWITSGGNSGQVSEAKGKIKNGVLGVFLLLISYTIFKTINPALLDLSLPKLTPVVEPPKVCCQKKSEDGKTPILRIRYNNCEDGETPLLNLTDCVIVKEATKKSMCPPGTHVITVKGPNDHPAFLEEAMDNCGANAYDPTTWHKLNNSLTTPVDGLKYYDGEYFGCYACTDPLRNELGPT